MEPLKIFIGFDPKETVAYHVLVQSLLEGASVPLAITPLSLPHLTSVFNRPRHPLQSTDFSFTRFLTPYLSNYQGVSLYMDCDMIVSTDIKQLFDLACDEYAVQCVQHQQPALYGTKFLDQPQSYYEKKNWSSLMLMNNVKCKALTPDYVNNATGLDLHQFAWLAHDKLIGSLPPEWNHLVSYQAADPNAKIIHYTAGGPYFEDYKNCQQAQKWFDKKANMLRVQEKQHVCSTATA